MRSTMHRDDHPAGSRYTRYGFLDQQTWQNTYVPQVLRICMDNRQALCVFLRIEPGIHSFER